MGELHKQFMAIVRDRIENEADAIGKEMVEGIQQSISKPVEYEGSIVIRSLPGEDPRYEFGHLWESERHEIENLGAVIELDVINDAAYARRLDQGDGSLKPRPFHRHATQHWFPQLVSRISEAIAGKR